MTVTEQRDELDAKAQRRHFAGAGAIGMLSGMLATGALNESSRPQAQRLVDEWEANAPSSKAPE